MDAIIDGTGEGYRAKVGPDNRLHTRAVTEDSGTSAALAGDLYNLNTETIILTTDSASSLLYGENTDSVPWIIPRVFYNTGTSTGGSGDFLAEIVANPKLGTLITEGEVLPAHNLSFGSFKNLTGLILKGSEGLNITDGEVRVSTIIPTSGIRILIGFDSIILNPGSSLAIRITPQVGNTNMKIQVGLNLNRYTTGGK